jgi:hypothetical protein
MTAPAVVGFAVHLGGVALVYLGAVVIVRGAEACWASGGVWPVLVVALGSCIGSVGVSMIKARKG